MSFVNYAVLVSTANDFTYVQCLGATVKATIFIQSDLNLVQAYVDARMPTGLTFWPSQTICVRWRYSKHLLTSLIYLRFPPSPYLFLSLDWTCGSVSNFLVNHNESFAAQFLAVLFYVCLCRVFVHLKFFTLFFLSLSLPFLFFFY